MTSPGLEWIGDDEQWRRAHQLVCDYQADAYGSKLLRAQLAGDGGELQR